MKHITIRSAKALLAGAALAGIASGGYINNANAAEKPVGEKAEKAKGETHSCKGKNSCKGKGGCKSGDMGCQGKNSCKGKGGCAVKDGKPVHPIEEKKA